MDFDTRNRVSFKPTPDHHLPLVTLACVPRLSDKTVTQLTRCGDRNIILSEEVTGLELHRIADRFPSDLVNTGDLVNKHIPAAKACEVVDTVLSQHNQRGYHDTSRLDAYLTTLADRELGIEEGLREALHSESDAIE